MRDLAVERSLALRGIEVKPSPTRLVDCVIPSPVKFCSATVPWLVLTRSWLGGLHASHLRAIGVGEQVPVRVDGEVRDSGSIEGGGTITYMLIADTD